MNSPQAFGPYELLERINIGGMAEVFRARDRDHQRFVAIKRILPSIAADEEFIEMFRDEATIASQLDHPNIAKIHDVGKVDQSFYLAIEFISGKDLRGIFDKAARSKQPPPLDFALTVIGAAAEALDYAHKRKDAKGRPLGVVHRDVSPQNILVSFEGDVKIIDFGIAKAAGKLARTQVGTIKGKFGYMSPEQVRGLPIDQRSDVFSLGICLWEVLALERLFSGDNEVVIMEKIRSCEIPRLLDRAPHVPTALEAIVMKALAKDVDERYASASELYSEITGFARAEGLTLDRARVAEFMRRIFAGDPALGASLEDKSVMADQKSGSDLDVFEGLSKKPAPVDETPTPFVTQPAPSRPVVPPLPRQRTLLGMPMPSGTPPTGKPLPVPPPGSPSKLPPPPGSRSSIPPGTIRVGPPPLPGSQPPLPGSQPPPRAAAPAPKPASPPAAEGARPPGVDVDMDWDEDEKTSVFERAEPTTVYGRQEAPAPSAINGPTKPAASPTRPGPLPMTNGLPPPPLPVPSVPPPVGRASGLPRPQAVAPQMAKTLAATTISPPPSRTSVTSVIASVRKSSRNRYLALGAGAALVVVAAVFVFSPKTGKVAVFASATSGRPLSKLSISVDGVEKCTTSPCYLDLEKGVHPIKVSSDGYAAQEQGATVHAGEEIAVNFKLDKAAAATGIRAAGRQEGVELFVDGKEIGPLPQEVSVPPGTHKIVFKGSDRYAPDERTVMVESEEMKDLGTISLKVVRGLATFDLRTTGAKVTLASGKDRRQLTDFTQPVEIETSKNWTVEASKFGYDDFKLPITFDDKAEKTFVISLTEHVKPEGPAIVAVAPRAAPAPEPRPAAEPPAESDSEEKAPRAAAPSGNCTLNFNSIPVSNVILDGRPLGGTPKLGVSAQAGPHTVVFVNPEEGKKVTSVTCKSGDTKTVAVRLSQ